jgi:hypothetical protein
MTRSRSTSRSVGLGRPEVIPSCRTSPASPSSSSVSPWRRGTRSVVRRQPKRPHRWRRPSRCNRLGTDPSRRNGYTYTDPYRRPPKRQVNIATDMQRSVVTSIHRCDRCGGVVSSSTIVVFTSDNRAEKFSWPDGGTSPFRGEKGLGWEGCFRTPFLIRWPGRIPGGQVLNGIMSLEDVVPTIMAAVGVPDVKEQLLEGSQAGDKQFRIHLDGYNQLPYLTGEVDESPRHEFYYCGERELYAIRYNNWNVHFQTKDYWFAGALVRPTMPKPANLRVDSFNSTWTPRPFRCAAARSWGPCCPPRRSSSNAAPRSTTSRPAKPRPGSTRKRSSKRSSRPPPNAKATDSNAPTRARAQFPCCAHRPHGRAADGRRDTARDPDPRGNSGCQHQPRQHHHHHHAPGPPRRSARGDLSQDASISS